MSELLSDLLGPIFQKELLKLGNQSISLLWLIELFVAVLAVGIVTRLLKKLLKYRVLGKFGIDSGNKEAIATLISLGVGTFGYLIVLQVSGLDLSSVAVIIGGLGVGIGFGLQDITKNLLSGLTVLFERKLKVGDFIEFDGIAGFIEEIDIRSTVIRTLEGGEVIIPNSQLAEERITNWNYRDCKGRLSIDVGVAYETDPVLVTETLLEAAYSLSSVLRDPPPKVIFDGFGDSALNFKLHFWISRIDRRAPIQSEVTFAVEYYLRRQGISIPFPQLDLWTRSPNELTSSLPKTLVEDITKSNLAKPINSENGEMTHPNPKPASSESLKATLSQMPYFQGFNELQIRSLIEMGFRQRIERDEIVVQQGEIVREVCIILSGEIAAFHIGKSTERHIHTFKAGEYFGELPLLLDVPAPGRLRATMPTSLFVINKANFEKLLDDYPALAEEVAESLSQCKEALKAFPEMWEGINANDKSNNGPAVWIKRRFQALFSPASA